MSFSFNAKHYAAFKHRQQCADIPMPCGFNEKYYSAFKHRQQHADGIKDTHTYFTFYHMVDCSGTE